MLHESFGDHEIRTVNDCYERKDSFAKNLGWSLSVPSKPNSKAKGASR